MQKEVTSTLLLTLLLLISFENIKKLNLWSSSTYHYKSSAFSTRCRVSLDPPRLCCAGARIDLLPKVGFAFAQCIIVFKNGSLILKWVFFFTKWLKIRMVMENAIAHVFKRYLSKTGVVMPIVLTSRHSHTVLFLSVSATVLLIENVRYVGTYL